MFGVLVRCLGEGLNGRLEEFELGLEFLRDLGLRCYVSGFKDWLDVVKG